MKPIKVIEWAHAHHHCGSSRGLKRKTQKLPHCSDDTHRRYFNESRHSKLFIQKEWKYCETSIISEKRILSKHSNFCCHSKWKSKQSFGQYSQQTSHAKSLCILNAKGMPQTPTALIHWTPGILIRHFCYLFLMFLIYFTWFLLILNACLDFLLCKNITI